MAAFRPTRVASPEVLKHLSRVNLIKLIERFADHFAGLKLPPSDPSQDEAADYSFIAMADRLLDTANPPPQELAKALFYIHSCATNEGEEEIEKALRKRAEDEVPLGEKFDEDKYLPRDNSTSHADLALHTWLLDPVILESIYPVLKMADPKSSMTYPAKTTAIGDPDLSRLQALELHLDDWFHHKKRRCRGTKIKHRYDDKDKAHHFIIERPDSFVRLGLMGKKAPDDFGFPERFDLVVIRTNPAELIVVARPKGIREKYRMAFGDYLYSDETLFFDTDKYTLEPLTEPTEAILQPRPKTNLREIKLVLMHYSFGPGSFVTHRNPNILEALQKEKGRLYLPKMTPTRAKFALYFDGEVDAKDQPKAVFMEIEPPHTCRYSRHCDTDAVDAWLEDEHFFAERKDA